MHLSQASILLVSHFLAYVSSQTDTTSIQIEDITYAPLPSYAPILSFYLEKEVGPAYQSLVGSVIAVDATATTIEVAARDQIVPEGQPLGGPRFEETITKKQPPSDTAGNATLVFERNLNGPFGQFGWNCTVNDQSADCTTIASCWQTEPSVYCNTNITTDRSHLRTEIETVAPLIWSAVAITAGAEKLHGTNTVTSTGGTQSSTGVATSTATKTSNGAQVRGFSFGVIVGLCGLISQLC
jgi:hypothetical protein